MNNITGQHRIIIEELRLGFVCACGFRWDNDGGYINREGAFDAHVRFESGLFTELPAHDCEMLPCPAGAGEPDLDDPMFPVRSVHTCTWCDGWDPTGLRSLRLFPESISELLAKGKADETDAVCRDCATRATGVAKAS